MHKHLQNFYSHGFYLLKDTLITFSVLIPFLSRIW